MRTFSRQLVVTRRDINRVSPVAKGRRYGPRRNLENRELRLSKCREALREAADELVKGGGRILVKQPLLTAPIAGHRLRCRPGRAANGPAMPASLSSSPATGMGKRWLEVYEGHQTDPGWVNRQITSEKRPGIQRHPQRQV